LNIAPGTVIEFKPNTGITVYGRLICGGSTFTDSIIMKPDVAGTEWDGIFLSDLSNEYGSMIYRCLISGATYGIRTDNISQGYYMGISRCRITDCDYGLYLEDTGPITIQYTTTDNCASAGIVIRNSTPNTLYRVEANDNRYGLYLLSGSSTGSLECKFSGNSCDGIVAGSGSNPSFCGGYNQIIDNDGNGVYCSGNSFPNFGNANNYGYNSIHGHHTTAGCYEIDNSNTGGYPISAQGNYWGGTPQSSWFNGGVDYSNYLESEPESVESDPTKYHGNPCQISSLDPLGNFYSAVNNQQWELAEEILTNLMSLSPSVAAQERIISLMGSLYRWSGNLSGGCEALSALLPNTSAKSFTRLSLMWLQKYSGNYTIALALADSLLILPNVNQDYRALALMDKGFLLKYDFEDPAAGNAVFASFLQQYPDHPQAFLVQSELRLEPSTTAGKGNLVAGISQPNEFKLHHAHPNPFNPSTIISYELRAASQVSLKVYDTAGRLITTLVDERQPAGSHGATFDGRTLSSGIYLAKLQAGEFTAVQKMVLLK
jgi:hypothetical protein